MRHLATKRWILKKRFPIFPFKQVLYYEACSVDVIRRPKVGISFVVAQVTWNPHLFFFIFHMTKQQTIHNTTTTTINRYTYVYILNCLCRHAFFFYYYCYHTSIVLLFPFYSLFFLCQMGECDNSICFVSGVYTLPHSLSNTQCIRLGLWLLLLNTTVVQILLIHNGFYKIYTKLH